MDTQQSAATQSAIDAPPLLSVEVQHYFTDSPSICIICLLNLLTQVIGTPSAPQPLVLSQGAGPSTAPIIMESSSSDEPMVQAPEQGTTASRTQLEEIRFKVVRHLSGFIWPIRYHHQPIYFSFLIISRNRTLLTIASSLSRLPFLTTKKSLPAKSP